MNIRTVFSLAMAALLLAGCITCPPVVRDGVVQLPCCASGSANIINIDTGTAPWRVMLPTQTWYQPVVVPAPNAAWAPVPQASWVRPPPASNRYPPGNYTYALQLAVPACSAGRTITITGRFAADNMASVFLDTPAAQGTSPIAAQTTTQGFLPANVTQFSTSIASASAGNYVLRVVVNNEPTFPSDTGMILQGAVLTSCP